MRAFQPGDFLLCEYRLRAIDGLVLSALETSVIWRTQGKGSEDIGVHFFERLSRDGLRGESLVRPRRLSTVLPNSPLSYDGRIVKIEWCVRVRLFYGEGQEVSRDHPFQLGNASLVEPQKNSAGSSHDDAS